MLQSPQTSPGQTAPLSSTHVPSLHPPTTTQSLTNLLPSYSTSTAEPPSHLPANFLKMFHTMAQYLQPPLQPTDNQISSMSLPVSSSLLTPAEDTVPQAKKARKQKRRPIDEEDDEQEQNSRAIKEKTKDHNKLKKCRK